MANNFQRRLTVAVAALAVCMTWHSTTRAAISQADRDNGLVECTQALRDRHDPELTSAPDRLVCFTAYLSNFDAGERQAPDGTAHHVAIPHWVIQRVDRAKGVAEGRGRPRAWFTIPELQAQGIAATDASYYFSQRFRNAHEDWYERGHLAQKYLAERLKGQAGWFTHNTANAVPQRGRFNKGPWLTLECYTGAWANKYATVWIITGPVFIGDHPREWLESDTRPKRASGPVPVAIPDALFKVVAKKNGTGAWDILAFIYPQTDPGYRKGPWNPAAHLDSVARIEELTHEQFFPALPPESQHLKREIAHTLWPVAREDFDPSCRRFAPEAS